jgi:hypothetical protein
MPSMPLPNRSAIIQYNVMNANSNINATKYVTGNDSISTSNNKQVSEIYRNLLLHRTILKAITQHSAQITLTVSLVATALV